MAEVGRQKRKSNFQEADPRQGRMGSTMSMHNPPRTRPADVPILNFSQTEHNRTGKNSTHQQNSPSQQYNSQIKKLYDDKEKSYKQQIQELINQNETLKLKHKQALVRISHLHGKLKMFLTEEQINSDAIKMVTEQTEKSYKEVIQSLKQKVESMVNRYQQAVRRLLEQYGCTWEQSSIQSYRNQGEVIEFLLRTFQQKANILRQYEAETRQKINNHQREYAKLEESVQHIIESNELYKMREAKYKEKLDQVRLEWTQVCQKLARKELDTEQWEVQNYQLRRRLEEQEMAINKAELGMNGHVESESAQVRALQTQLADMTTRISQMHLKYQQLWTAYEQARLAMEQQTIKSKMREQEFQRIHREAVRWKERYEWLEKEKKHNLQIIQAQNIKLRDELYHKSDYKLSDSLSPITSRNHQHNSGGYLPQQFSLKAQNREAQYQPRSNEYARFKPTEYQRTVYSAFPVYNEQYQDIAQETSPQISSRKILNKAPDRQMDEPPPKSSSPPLQSRMKKIQTELAKRGIKTGPTDQRLEELIRQFQTKLWKANQRNPDEQ